MKFVNDVKMIYLYDIVSGFAIFDITISVNLSDKAKARYVSKVMEAAKLIVLEINLFLILIL